jgi:hypothetical protein
VLTLGGTADNPNMRKVFLPRLRVRHLKGERTMNQDNRVLARLQARILTEKEIQAVSGGVQTKTKCSFIAGKLTDGDTGEC